MKIYPRLLFNTLPLIFVGLVLVGSITYYLSHNAMNNLAEKWLATKLADATGIATENLMVLSKYGLDGIEANIVKAQSHAGEAISMIPVGGKGYLWIVNSKGVVVVHPDPARIGKNVSGAAWFEQMISRFSGKTSHMGEHETMLAVYKYFGPWDWYIMASAPPSELYGEANRMRTYVLGAGLAALILMAVVSMILARRLTAPLNMLAKEAERIGSGDHGVVATLDRNDEIGTLSAAFNSMTRQLSRRISQEQLISDISGQFIYLSAAEKIDQAIIEALEKIGKYTTADRSYVGEFSMEDHLVANTHEWCREGVEPQTDNIIGLSLKSMPWLIQRLEEEGFILTNRIDELPVEAAPEKKIWQSRGLQSVLRVPMTYGGQLRGFVGIESGREQAWSQQEIAILKRAAELFYNTLERQWYQEKLAAEKEQLSVTLQSIGDGVITTDVDGNVVLINLVAEKLTGWSNQDAAGHPIEDVFTIINEKSHRKRPNPITRAIATGNPTEVVSPSLLRSKDGQERLISSSVAPISNTSGKVIGDVLVFRDITDKHRMEEEMLKVEKLESIGVLAGGIAHDFNNILTAIIGNIALTKQYASKDSRTLEKLTEIEKASFRAKNLTQQLLTFSKGGTPIKKAIALDELFYDAAMFALGGSKVGMEFKAADGLWQVKADEGQISQVVNNLVLNAVQAMPAGGVIHVDMDNETLSSLSPLPLPAGRYVKIDLQDYGSGIPKENLGRIFDPFYTTKKAGSGLGLATSYSIIEKHGGYITVDSRPGSGTLFTLYFPSSDEEITNIAAPTQKINQATGRILVMDDEDIIRAVVGDILTASGYGVAFAKDGTEMLDLYMQSKNNGNTFDAVIMDLTIPGGMGGKEAIGRLLEADPQAKAIVSSGYSTDPVMANFSDYGFSAAVSKPFQIEELYQTLNDVIKSNPPSK